MAGSRLVLDIGCGGRPKGDVNIDRFFGDTPHDKLEIKSREIKNFILADACHLPIKRGVFDTVYSSHVIEHIQEPTKFIKETKWASRSLVILRTPNNRILRDDEVHLYSWSKDAFGNLLGLFFNKVEVETNSFIELYAQRRFFKILRYLPGLQNAFLRLASRLLGYELVATCIV